MANKTRREGTEEVLQRKVWDKKREKDLFLQQIVKRHPPMKLFVKAWLQMSALAFRFFHLPPPSPDALLA